MGIEMIVRRSDKVNLNSKSGDAQCTKRGDVIAVKEQPCNWSERERNNPDWVILEFDDMTIGDAEAFLQTEQPIAATEAQPLLKKRIMSLNLDEMTKRIREEDKMKDKANWADKFKHSRKHVEECCFVKDPAPTVTVKV